MAEVTYRNFKIKKIDIINDIKRQGEIHIKQNFSFQVEYNKENTKARATLTEFLDMEEAPQEFRVEITLEGFFDLAGVVDEESKSDAHVKCYDLLYPHFDQIFSQLAATGGIPSIPVRKNPIRKEDVRHGQPAAAPKQEGDLN